MDMDVVCIYALQEVIAVKINWSLGELSSLRPIRGATVALCFLLLTE